MAQPFRNASYDRFGEETEELRALAKGLDPLAFIQIFQPLTMDEYSRYYLARGSRRIQVMSDGRFMGASLSQDGDAIELLSHATLVEAGEVKAVLREMQDCGGRLPPKRKAALVVAHAVLDMCRSGGCLGAIIGRPATGKTTAALLGALELSSSMGFSGTYLSLEPGLQSTGVRLMKQRTAGGGSEAPDWVVRGSLTGRLSCETTGLRFVQRAMELQDILDTAAAMPPDGKKKLVIIDDVSELKPKRALLQSLRDCAKKIDAVFIILGTLNRSSADSRGNFRKLSIRGLREAALETQIDCALAMKQQPEPEAVRVW